MTGDCHVRFCESRGVRFPPATRQKGSALSDANPDGALANSPITNRVLHLHLVDNCEVFDGEEDQRCFVLAAL